MAPTVKNPKITVAHQAHLFLSFKGKENISNKITGSVKGNK